MKLSGRNQGVNYGRGGEVLESNVCLNTTASVDLQFTMRFKSNNSFNDEGF